VLLHDLRTERRSRAGAGGLLLDITLSTRTKPAILRALDELG